MQRFLTEGFLTLTPDVAPGVMQQIDKWLKEMTPPVVTSEEEGLALEKKVIRGVERGYLVMDAEGKVTSANGKRTSEYDNTNREDPVLCAPTWILSASSWVAEMGSLQNSSISRSFFGPARPM